MKKPVIAALCCLLALGTATAAFAEEPTPTPAPELVELSPEETAPQFYPDSISWQEDGGQLLVVKQYSVPYGTAVTDLTESGMQWGGADYLALDKGLSSLKSVTYEPADPDQAADYKVLQAEVGQTTDAFAIDESSEWRNYYDNEYRDALKQAVNGDLTPSDALTEFATALADKAGWAH